MFACYLFSCYSAYIHAFIAIERWNAISRPLTALTSFTFKTNRLILIALFLACVAINLPLLWFPSIDPILSIDESSSLGLRIDSECKVAQDLILYLIDSIFSCLLPFSLTTLFSMLTLFKLIRIQSSAKQPESNQSEILNNKSVVSNCTSVPTSASPTLVHGLNKFQSSQNSQKSNVSESKKFKVFNFTR